MRRFSYFLFENFDAGEEAENPGNPRLFFGKDTDIILSYIAQQPANACAYNDCCNQFGSWAVQRLIDGGVLRLSGTALAFDCPIFLREDAAVLHEQIAIKAVALADLLEAGMADIRVCCAGIKNGFTVEQNLYHVLCGMIFDGYFFDYLSQKGVLSTSRQHPSGLDYLTVIYESCEALRLLSDGLLCSYNRLVNSQCALQSFGDAMGDRFDFYRFFRRLEQGELPAKFKDAETLLLGSFGGAAKEALLREVVSLVKTGNCSAPAIRILEKFGYVQEGRISVPVYTSDDQKQIMEIESMVERHLGGAMCRTMAELASSIDITAVKHKVNSLEIANELYHIIFGTINEELVSRKLVSAPRSIPGEGRYLKCVELYI